MPLVTIVGVGALGSHVLQLMRNVDTTIRVIDFDRVETKNVQSQFHSKPNVGKLKVESVKQAMQFLFGTKIETRSAKLVENNVAELLGGSDLVIDCLDNAKARRVVQAYVRANNVPCLHGALDANGTFGRAVWDQLFQIDEEGAEGAATCENGEFLPFIGITAAYLAQVARMFLKSAKKLSYHIHPGGVENI